MYVKKRKIFFVIYLIVCVQLTSCVDTFEDTTLFRTVYGDTKSVLKGDCSSEQEGRMIELSIISLVVVCAGMAGAWLVLRRADKKDDQQNSHKKSLPSQEQEQSSD